jgi:cytidylate kinase
MSAEHDRSVLKIAVVGPCASGKSTLVKALEKQGYHARQIAQEHSYVPDMWEVMTQPDILIYLDASYGTCTKRKNLDWTPAEYHAQVERLAYARQRCDLYIDSDEATPEEIADQVMGYIKQR